jgi:MarR family transcriptional regulator, temperature-dependent positive regulator of motility
MANRLARLPAAKAEAAAPRAGSSPRSGDLELGVLTSSLGYLLRRLQLAYKKHFLREAHATGLQPRHVGAMYVIGLNPGVTPSQMSAALGLDAVQTALMLNALEERGLIVRRLSRTDGRSRAVHLTPAGRRAFAKLQVVATRVEQDFVSAALTQQEAAQLISLMTRLLGSDRV